MHVYNPGFFGHYSAAVEHATLVCSAPDHATFPVITKAE